MLAVEDGVCICRIFRALGWLGELGHCVLQEELRAALAAAATATREDEYKIAAELVSKDGRQRRGCCAA